jgi:hypothetical protein
MRKSGDDTLMTFVPLESAERDDEPGNAHHASDGAYEIAAVRDNGEELGGQAQRLLEGTRLEAGDAD